jgi:selenocysteine-specific elongation factor
LRHVVLGTAGHIDHGKSALVQALTGIDPDRLKEEKRRGITIELGFADMEVGADRVISFVDVPGHERFVRHMVAGATGIEAVLLVVAADQGVQPQTREHLEICSLLGLERGVVALSKCDLVDPDLREVAALEVRELLEETFLDGAPLVAVSARTREGLDRLREALAHLCEQPPPRPVTGLPRLPVDRSFVLRGFGTVVTGTLVSGTLRQGDEVEIQPGGRRARIRGLQVHHRQVESADAGRRTAVNLQGLDCADVPRGATLVAPGALCPTRRIWAHVTLLPRAPRALARGGPVRFHQGTCERAGRYRVLSRGENDSFNVELHLDEPTVLAPGDRFVLRRPAPVDTVGGGTVVDVNPPAARSATADAFTSESLRPEVALRLRLVRAGAAGREPGEVATELGLTREQLEAKLERLDGEAAPVLAGARWIDGGVWRETERRVLDNLAAFHRGEPLRLGMAREELRARSCAEMHQEAWRRMLDGMAERGMLRLSGEWAAAAGHEVVLSDEEQELAERLEQRFRQAGLEPPELETLIDPAERPRATKLVDLLVARGRLVRIHDGKLFHARALEELRVKLGEFAKRSRMIGVADFKDLAGITRKHAIPLLEHLDAERTTRRVGNQREILI